MKIEITIKQSDMKLTQSLTSHIQVIGDKLWQVCNMDWYHEGLNVDDEEIVRVVIALRPIQANHKIQGMKQINIFYLMEKAIL